MAGYTRNDTGNNIADGNVINASDLDGEYNAIEAAFNESTGHSHDGTSAEGAPITVVGPVQDVEVSATAIQPKTASAGNIDLGASGAQFKDLFIDGLAYIDGLGENLLVNSTNEIQFRDSALKINSSADGQLDIDADTELELTAPTVDINASTSVNISNDLKLDSDSAILSLGADGEVTLTHLHNVGTELKVENATTTSVTDILDLQVESSGTPGVGIGTGLTFSVETAGGNVETAGAIRAVATGLTPTDEELDLVFYSMRNGSLTEAFRYDSDGDTFDVTGTVTATAIDDTPIGGTTTAAGSFTTLQADTSLNVDGTVTADGLTVDGTGTLQGSSGSTLNIKSTNGTATTGDLLGQVLFVGSDGSTPGGGTKAKIRAEVVSAVGDDSQLIFSTSDGTTNDIDRMLIANNGNVGIGTASPTGKLSVVTSTIGDTAFSLNRTGSVRFDFTTGITGVTGDALQINDSSANNYLTLRSGNVGIGTSSPDKQLHIESSTGGTIRLSSSDTTVGAGESLGEIDWYSNDGSGSGSGVRAFINVVENDSGLGRAYDMTFGTGNVATATEAMRIDKSGNVGIGTDSPAENISISTSGNTQDVAIQLIATNSAGNQSNGAKIKAIGSAAENGLGTLTFETRRNNLAYEEAMRIDSSGNVGIGVTPEAWNTYKAIQVGSTGYIASPSSGVYTQIGNNAYYDGAWKYTTTAAATNLNFSTGGGLFFQQAASGTADTAITWTDSMTLDASGNVGIGTTSPDAPLHINGGFAGSLIIDGTDSIRPSTDDSLITISGGDATNSGANYSLFGGTHATLANIHRWRVGGTEAMRIDSDGNVGIGEDDPTKTVHVSFSDSTTTDLNSGSGIQINNKNNGTGTLAPLLFSTDSGRRVRSAIAHVDTGNYGKGDLVFYTMSDGDTSGAVIDTSDESMRIDSSGNVGIGTSSPVTTLDVQDSNQTATDGVGNINVFSTDTAGIDLGGSITLGGSYSGTTKASFASISARKENATAGNTAGYLAFTTRANAASQAERMRIDSSGNLLIGNGVTAGTASAGNLVLTNGTAPTGNVTNGITLYAEDVSASSELKVRDEAGNVTTLSPHNFDLIPEGPSEDMAWSYYSEREGKRINVDMLKAIRLLEQLTGEKLVHTS